MLLSRVSTIFLLSCLYYTLDAEILLVKFKLGGLTCEKCMGPLKNILEERIQDIKEIKSIHMGTGIVDAIMKDNNKLTFSDIENNIVDAIKTSQTYTFNSLKRATIKGVPLKENNQLFLKLSSSEEKIVLDEKFASVVERAASQRKSMVLLGTLSKKGGLWKLSPATL